MKILIVEDNPDMRDLVCLILERLYYIPVLACHGKEGLEKAIAEKPQLILMDMKMPVMDGWEAAKALRANPDTKNIPILATTALFRPHELKTCLEAGCNDYIVKPFSLCRSPDQNSEKCWKRVLNNSVSIDQIESSGQFESVLNIRYRFRTMLL